MPKFNYPKARRDETAIDVYHGVEVKDPYRWLENPDSEETKSFIEAQNAISIPFIHACPKRQAIHDRLTHLFNYPWYSCPFKRGNKFYYFMNTGLQNHSVLYVQDSLDGEPRVFFDPNTLSEDGTVALTDVVFSRDANILSYGLSKSGSDWKTIHFMDVNTGKKYPEVLEKAKFTNISWTFDNKGIVYGCYPDQIGKPDGSETVVSRNQKIYYHRVGTPQSQDVLVVEFPQKPLWSVFARITNRGKWLLVVSQPGTGEVLVHYAKLNPNEEITGKLQLTEVVGTLDAEYGYVTNIGTRAVFKTNKNAPNYKLMSIDLENLKKDDWSELMAEHPHNVLDWVSVVDEDKLLVCYMEDVKNVLSVHCLRTGKLLRHLPIDIGTISDFSAKKELSQIFYTHSSFLSPGIMYTIDLKKDEPAKVYREIKIDGFDASLFKMTQIFYPSKDGTKIPMFIVAKKDVVLDGSSPCLLYGYGGFNISMQPLFSTSRTMFLQNLNGIFAMPSIRGGGEYGEKWHNGGRLAKKQNTFDDFQYAAKYLIEHGYTSAKKIVIEGSSNGGLLVAACINQRPDLFGAAIADVGVMDMLKFHKFTIGHSWTSEYGSPDDPEQFKTLIKYSPLHNVKPPKISQQYPATLLLTADHDDRVVPLHSLKLIATLQHEIGQLPQQTNPLLIMIEVKAGHGNGKPTAKTFQILAIISLLESKLLEAILRNINHLIHLRHSASSNRGILESAIGRTALSTKYIF